MKKRVESVTFVTFFINKSKMVYLPADYGL
jgi:hypothetical protein